MAGFVADHQRAVLWAFPTMVSAYSAKEYCSCRYVMGYFAEYWAVAVADVTRLLN